MITNKIQEFKVAPEEHFVENNLDPIHLQKFQELFEKYLGHVNIYDTHKVGEGVQFEDKAKEIKEILKGFNHITFSFIVHENGVEGGNITHLEGLNAEQIGEAFYIAEKRVQETVAEAIKEHPSVHLVYMINALGAHKKEVQG